MIIADYRAKSKFGDRPDRSRRYPPKKNKAIFPIMKNNISSLPVTGRTGPEDGFEDGELLAIEQLLTQGPGLVEGGGGGGFTSGGGLLCP